MDFLWRPLFLAFLMGETRAATIRIEEQLYEDLLWSYNKIARPVKNSSEILEISFGAALIRLIDVDEKNQILTTNLWLEMQWTDSKLQWDPLVYAGIKKLHIPSDLIWTPDIVLYNNAAGDPDITIYTDALVYYSGTVVWKPPAIYKSFCAIDVTWFPYDIQDCKMKFGTWTYTGFYVDMRLLPIPDVAEVEERVEEGSIIEHLTIGMDLSYFYSSAEWDLLNLTSARHEKIYPGCCGPEKYVDITYYFTLRRKTLFFTCNLIIPNCLISFLTTFVFYLSDHKITFAISILVTLFFFFLILIDIIPPTSLVIPMFARYLLTTMILVSMSVMISVISVNFHFRRGSTHIMPNWMRTVFITWLPKVLCMERPKHPEVTKFSDGQDLLSFRAPSPISAGSSEAERRLSGRVEAPPPILNALEEHSPLAARKHESDLEKQNRLHRQLIYRVLQHVRFIADHFREQEDEDEVSDDWTYVAMVIDRMFLILFSFLNAGTLLIILQAPSLRDSTEPLKIPAPTTPLGQDSLGYAQTLAAP